MNKKSEWAAFYRTLNRLGPRLLKGVPPGLDEYIRLEAEDSDSFWSSWLEGDYSHWVDGDPEIAVRRGLEDWVSNVKEHLKEILGPDSLIPFGNKGISYAQRTECIASVDGINLRLDEEHLRTFIDSVLLDCEDGQDFQGLLVQSIVQPCTDTSEGTLIRALCIPWRMIVNSLKNDWQKAFQISSRQWEEMIAAAFDQAGYDEVILTPRSGDHGRDVIAIKKGVGSIRIIDSVKAYKPGHLVRYDDVRALAGVLLGDQGASKGIVTTTSAFAPGIVNDPFLQPLMPYRLELMDGIALQKWLEDIALGCRRD